MTCDSRFQALQRVRTHQPRERWGPAASRTAALGNTYPSRRSPAARSRLCCCGRGPRATGRDEELFRNPSSAPLLSSQGHGLLTCSSKTEPWTTAAVLLVRGTDNHPARGYPETARRQHEACEQAPLCSGRGTGGTSGSTWTGPCGPPW